MAIFAWTLLFQRFCRGIEKTQGRALPSSNFCDTLLAYLRIMTLRNSATEWPPPGTPSRKRLPKAYVSGHSCRNRAHGGIRVWLLFGNEKTAKNQVILGVAAAEMAGNSRVIEVREEYPLVWHCLFWFFQPAAGGGGPFVKLRASAE